MFVCSVVGSGCLPKGSYQLVLYSWSVTSSIVGPWDEVSESRLLRATLPMEVVTMSIYVIPVASSLMMWLILMVEIPGVATTPMDMVPWGTSEAISRGCDVRRQAVTPAKLHGGVIGHMTANACTGEKGLDGVGVFNRGTGGFAGPARGRWVGPPLGLEALHGGEISSAATTGQEGCRIFSHPKNLGLLLSMANSGVQGILGMSVGRVSRLWSPSFSGRATPWSTSSSEKEGYHFTSSLNSFMLLASQCGPPPAGGLISSAQCWRALAYATTFSWRISLISLHA